MDDEKLFLVLDSLLPDFKSKEKILEVGCGEGKVAGHVMQKYGKQHAIDAFDISEKVILDAQKKYPDIQFSVGDGYNIIGGGYELVLCCEVLEHLEYPEKVLKQIKKATNKYIIVSVPREPIWRCLNMVRGKYLRTFGNTPGHIQHWNTRCFFDFLQKNGLKIKQLKKPLPWIMVLIEKE